jgi:hypothetical protein
MTQIIQRSFTGGELAPAMRARADLTKYATGLALAENMIVRSQGGVYSRPGTKFVGYVNTPSLRPRLIPFTFNTDQAYILVFEHLTLRFVKDGQFILTAPLGPAYQITTPFTSNELLRIQFEQDADVMTLVHPNHDPVNLNRFADANWTITTVNFASSVNAPTNTADVGITAGACTNITRANPAVVTTNVPHGFASGAVVTIYDTTTPQMHEKVYTITVTGASTFSLNGCNSTGYPAFVSASYLRGIFTLGTGGGTYSKTYEYVVTTVSTSGVESVASVSRSIVCNSLTSTFGVRIQWEPGTNVDYYRIYKSPATNTGIYGWIGDSKTTVFDDFNLAPLTSDAPPQDRQPFSGVGNKPAVIGYYQQRLIYANTGNGPVTAYATQTGIYDSLRTSVPSRSDDAITFSIKGRQVNEIRHIVALDKLIVMTAGAEQKVTEGINDVLTPATVGVRVQSYNGASWVPPVVVNDTVLFIQEKGARLRDLKYELGNDKYGGTDLSILAEHLFEDRTIIEMTYSQEPYGILWASRDDGVLLGMTYQREHQVWAWHHHTTDGQFESIATISEGGRDAVYCVVKRNINGVDTRYVERFEKRTVSSAADSYSVDCGVIYNGVATTVITGLNHLNGEAVTVVADGNEVRNLTVSSNQVTLPRAASKVSVGLGYTPIVELLDVDFSGGTESIRGKEKSISKVILEVENSRGGWVGPKKEGGAVDQMIEIKPRFDSDSYNSLSLHTFKEEVFIQPLWSKSGGIRIEQRAPFPFSILAAVPEVDVS